MVYYWKKIKYYFPYFREGGSAKVWKFPYFFFEPFPNQLHVDYCRYLVATPHRIDAVPKYIWVQIVNMW